MKIMMFVISAMVGMSARAEQKVTVYVNNDAVPGSDLQIAEVRATEIFSSAGVRIEWHGRVPDSGRLPGGAIAIRLDPQTPVLFLPGSLAVTRFQGGHITVFWDRIHRTLRPAPPDVVLGYVLVHEITHILQGSDRHSDSGVMKARWTDRDYAAMAYNALLFTPEDILLIHDGRAR